MLKDKIKKLILIKKQKKTCLIKIE
jgi:hypothetical protein